MSIDTVEYSVSVLLFNLTMYSEFIENKCCHHVSTRSMLEFHLYLLLSHAQWKTHQAQVFLCPSPAYLPPPLYLVSISALSRRLAK